MRAQYGLIINMILDHHLACSWCKPRVTSSVLDNIAWMKVINVTFAVLGIGGPFNCLVSLPSCTHNH